MAAGRFHSVMYTKDALFTFGLNAGQLGKNLLFFSFKLYSITLLCQTILPLPTTPGPNFMALLTRSEQIYANGCIQIYA